MVRLRINDLLFQRMELAGFHHCRRERSGKHSRLAWRGRHSGVQIHENAASAAAIEGPLEIRRHARMTPHST